MEQYIITVYNAFPELLYVLKYVFVPENQGIDSINITVNFSILWRNDIPGILSELNITLHI